MNGYTRFQLISFTKNQVHDHKNPKNLQQTSLLDDPLFGLIKNNRFRESGTLNLAEIDPRPCLSLNDNLPSSGLQHFHTNQQKDQMF